jgi:hypothetical protein
MTVEKRSGGEQWTINMRFTNRRTFDALASQTCEGCGAPPGHYCMTRNGTIGRFHAHRYVLAYPESHYYPKMTTKWQGAFTRIEGWTVATVAVMPPALQGSSRLLKAQHTDVWSEVEGMWESYLKDSAQSNSPVCLADFATHIIFMLGFTAGRRACNCGATMINGGVGSAHLNFCASVLAEKEIVP